MKIKVIIVSLISIHIQYRPIQEILPKKYNLHILYTLTITLSSILQLINKQLL
jgi:hypothetical protein